MLILIAKNESMRIEKKISFSHSPISLLRRNSVSFFIETFRSLTESHGFAGEVWPNIFA